MMFFKLKKKYTETINKLNEVGLALSTEDDINRLLERILEKAKSISNADNGALYLLEGDKLKCSIAQSTSLGVTFGGTSSDDDGEQVQVPPIKLYSRSGRPDKKLIPVYVAIQKQSLNIRNLKFFSHFAQGSIFNSIAEYIPVSVLAVPITNQKNEVLGVIHLVNAKNKQGRIIPFSKEIESLIESLASQAAVSIENQTLKDEQRNILEGIIKMLALAIDAKSSHTSNHCQAIPVLTEMIAKAAIKQKDGYFRDFHMDSEELYELRVASWLHDCGKLTIPLTILDKATKLETTYDRINAIHARFETVARDLEIAHLRKQIKAAEYKQQLKQLKSDWQFIQSMNKGSEYVDDAKLKRLKQIANYKWNQTLNGEKIKTSKLLTKDELANLSIRKGTINEEERQIINSHIDVTIDMLNSLPFPKNLQRVPEYAGGHHEKMDGTGFPKGLTREEMSVPARMMAVADIFEALTAYDRPYKKPKKLSESIAIMTKMRDENHIDPDIFDLFIKEKIYLKYAKKFLLPEQIDEI
ncbi:MAG: metal dependent phosphohydrolase [Rickettsiaceae bacterium]|jgi:HD-GYP domain-containing protein (c-di-GMP phosphodiesterase class II)|nr:metal dependent phosphohydrolase [Rickettsiaceae bacterium]